MTTLRTKIALAELQAIEADYCTAAVNGSDTTPIMTRALEFVLGNKPAKARSEGATWLFVNFNIAALDQRGGVISDELRAHRQTRAARRRAIN